MRLTLRSNNRKTGPIPVSTSEEETCPPECPFRGNGCYASGGPLKIHWDKVSRGDAGSSWSSFCASIRALPKGQLWRHNQAGDLPGKGNRIAPKKLEQLVEANEGKRGFTYTHKPPTKANLRAIRRANDNGFTINLSANSPSHADQLAEHGLPVVTVLPTEASGKLETPEGRPIVICPAITHGGITCATCGLCQVRGRKAIVGFPAHGSAHKIASKIATD